MSRRSLSSTTVRLKKKGIRVVGSGKAKNLVGISRDLLQELQLSYLKKKDINNLANLFDLFLNLEHEDILESVINKIVPNISYNDLEDFSVGDAEILLSRRLLLAFKFDCLGIVGNLLAIGANPFRKGFLDNKFATIFELIIDICPDKVEYAKAIEKLILNGWSDKFELENPLVGAIDLVGNKTNIKAVLKIYEKKLFG